MFTSHGASLDNVAPEELGDPVNGTTSYALCIYDETQDTPSRQASLAVPPGGACANGACWKSTKSGLKYGDPEARAAGVRTLRVKFGPPLKTKVKVVARGSNAPAIALPFDQDNEVIVQLINSEGTCWETKYQAPARHNTDARFLDRAELP